MLPMFYKKTMEKMTVDLKIKTDLRGQKFGLWIGICPWCGKQHVHGAGRDLSEAGLTAMLGHRVAHCYGGQSYLLERKILHDAPNSAPQKKKKRVFALKAQTVRI
jgi:hypothetical protein